MNKSVCSSGWEKKAYCLFKKKEAIYFPSLKLLVMLLNFDPFLFVRMNVGQVSVVAVN